MCPFLIINITFHFRLDNFAFRDTSNIEKNSFLSFSKLPK